MPPRPLSRAIVPVIIAASPRRRHFISPAGSSRTSFTLEGDEYEMVQTYGATPVAAEDREPDLQPSNSEGLSEGDALLGAEASVRRPKRDGHATLSSSVGNLANTIIGSGALSVALGR